MISIFKVIHYYLQMDQETLEENVLQYINLIIFIFFISTWISMETCLRMSEKNVELLTDIDMLLMVKKRIRGGICHVIHRYAIANNKYIKNGYIITTKDHLIFNI